MSPDPSKARVVQDLAHGRPLICCRFDPTGRFAFAGSEDRTIRRWTLDGGAQVGLEGHEGWVHALAFTPDGLTLLSAGSDGRLLWWPAADESPRPTQAVEAHRGWIHGIAVSPTGELAATCGVDRVVRLWSVAEGSPVRELAGHEKHVYRVAFDPTGETLVSADLRGRVIQWDLATGREIRCLDAGALYKYEAGQGVDYGGVRDLAFSPDGSRLACSGLIEASNPLGAVSNPAAVVLDWSSGGEALLLRPKADVKGVGWGVRYLSTGDLAMVSGGTGGGHLWFFRPGEPNEFATLSLGNTGRDLDLHPDGLRLATAHHDGHLRVVALMSESGA